MICEAVKQLSVKDTELCAVSEHSVSPNARELIRTEWIAIITQLRQLRKIIANLETYKLKLVEELNWVRFVHALLNFL